MSSPHTGPWDVSVYDAVRPGRRDDQPIPVELRSVADCVQAARDCAGAELLLGGGEPTLRPDLLEVLRAMSASCPPETALGLRTDGLALAQPGVVASLLAAGLRFVQVVLFAARPQAQDTLVGVDGHGKAALRGVRATVRGGLEARIELVLTRPGLSLVAESLGLLAELGVRNVTLRPLRAEGAFAETFPALSPRFGLLGPPLDAASREAARLGVALVFDGIPACYLPRGVAARAPAVVAAPAAPSGGRCSRCDPRRCTGVPAEYTGAFGWDELAPDGEPAPMPAVRVALRGPTQHACATCGDREGPTPEPASPEPTRPARLRLLRAASRTPARIRLASSGSLHHPAAAELLRELVRIDGPQVEVAGDLSPVALWSEDALHRVRKVARVDAALFGPDAARHDVHVGRAGAFHDSLRALSRFPSGVHTGAYAVLHDALQVPDYAAAWQTEALPGSPAFRLSPIGGSLNALADAALALPEGASRSALLPLLPACLRDATAPLPEPATWTLDGPNRGGFAPSGADRLGTYQSCPHPCALHASCPGLATGWTASLPPPQETRL